MDKVWYITSLSIGAQGGSEGLCVFLCVRCSFMHMKVETKYNGYRFRSRLEARWAVFLDHFQEPYEYEGEWYWLPGFWLPDFWLPRMECWLEIKRTQPTEGEMKLYQVITHNTGYPIILAWSMPKVNMGNTKVYGLLLDENAGCIEWSDVIWAVDYCGKLCVATFTKQCYRQCDSVWRAVRGVKRIARARPVTQAEVVVAKTFEFNR